MMTDPRRRFAAEQTQVVAGEIGLDFDLDAMEAEAERRV
jgi:hypothetical protein